MIELKQFPKSEKLLQEFFRRNLEAFQKNVMKEAPTEILEIPKIEDEWVKKYTESSLVTNPGILTSFFDENGIIMEIGVDRTMEPKFCYSFGENNSDLFYTRTEAEMEGWKECFKQLEQRL